MYLFQYVGFARFCVIVKSETKQKERILFTGEGNFVKESVTE